MTTAMLTLHDARKLVNHVENLADFRFIERNSVSYDHVGAVLADAVLQAGVNYVTVVVPRVRRILSDYSFAATTSAFQEVLNAEGEERVLQWKHPEKQARVRRLMAALRSHGIESEEELALWLDSDSTRDELLRIHGVGPKARDYLAGLVGADVVAVDRHLVAFVRMAGLRCHDYRHIQGVVNYAADLVGIRRRTLDYSIWCYQRERRGNLKLSALGKAGCA